MANTTIAGLTTITGANIATDDRFIVRDTSANIDLAITAAEMRNMVVSAPIVLPTTISVNTSSNALRITQTGSGNALAVEDSTNPDATPFVVNANGDVGVGTTAPTSKLEVAGGSFRIQGAAADPNYYTNFSHDYGTGVLNISSTVGGGYVNQSVFKSTVGANSSIILYTGGNSRLLIDNGGNVGVGTSAPVNRLHTVVASATTNATIFPVRVEAQTTGTPAIGIGTGIALATETATGDNVEIGATIESVATNVTNGAENFDLVFKTMSGGATAVERLRVSSAGVLTTTNNAVIAGTASVNGGTLSTTATTFNAIDTTATTVNAFRAAAALNIGYNSTAASTTNIVTGATNSGQTKAINIGTGGVAGSTTNIVIGSTGGGTTTIQTPSLAVTGTITSGTWNGGVVSSTYGGTGVNNGGRTITLNTGNLTLNAAAAGSTMTLTGGALTLNAAAGGSSVTLTSALSVTGGALTVNSAAGGSSVTLTGGALTVNSAAGGSALTLAGGGLSVTSAAGGSSISLAGNLTVNTGSLTVTPQAAGSSITLGGNIVTANSVTTSGNFALTLTTTATTNVTLPTTGTLSTLAGTETLTNKTINLANNTLTGTMLQFSTAVSNGTLVALSNPATFTPTAAAPGAVGFSTANTFVVVTPNATGAYTTTVPVAGTVCYLMVLTSGTTSFTLTFGTGFRPTTTLATGTVTGKYFTLGFISDGTNMVEISRTAAT